MLSLLGETIFHIKSNFFERSTQCNIYSVTTETHFDKSHVKYIGKDAFRIPLKYPIPVSIYSLEWSAVLLCSQLAKINQLRRRYIN